MKFWRPHSLRRRLAWRLVLLQTITLSLASALLTILILQLNPGEQIVDSSLAEAIAVAMQRGPDGELVLGPSPALDRYRAESSTVWMIVTDATGQTFENGPVPAAYSDMASSLNRLWFVDIRDSGNENMAAAFHSQETPIGKLYVLAGGGFPVTVKNAGVVGVIAVSGLPERDDHGVIVDALCEYLGKDARALALPAAMAE